MPEEPCDSIIRDRPGSGDNWYECQLPKGHDGNHRALRVWTDDDAEASEKAWNPDGPLTVAEYLRR